MKTLKHDTKRIEHMANSAGSPIPLAVGIGSTDHLYSAVERGTSETIIQRQCRYVRRQVGFAL